MRKVKIVKWDSKDPTGKDVKEDLLDAINVLIVIKKPESIPRGIEKFQIFGKIADAFDEAVKTGILKLEEREYKFLKETIENEVPSTWAMNRPLAKAITEFLELKEEK
jgi:hypothetical protein